MAGPVILWRRRGCRCAFLSAEVAGFGWLVSLPVHRGSTRISPTAPAAWKSLAPDEGEWMRYASNGHAVRWLLPLNPDDWPEIGELPTAGESAPLDPNRVDFRNAPPTWHLPLRAMPPCQHGGVSARLGGMNLRDALVAHAREVVRDRRRVVRDLASTPSVG